MDTITISCETCSGAGHVTVTRSRWVGGSIAGYRSTITGAVRCDDCAGSGTVPAITCDACGAVVPADEAIPTIDGEGYVCEICYEAEQAAILEAHPELAHLKAWVPGPEVPRSCTRTGATSLMPPHMRLGRVTVHGSGTVSASRAVPTRPAAVPGRS